MKINKLLTEVYHSSYPKWVKEAISYHHKALGPHGDINQVSTEHQPDTTSTFSPPSYSVRVDFNKDPFIEGLPDVIDRNTFIFCAFVSTKRKESNGLIQVILANQLNSPRQLKDLIAVDRHLGFFQILTSYDYYYGSVVISKKEGLPTERIDEICIEDLPDYAFGLGYIKGNTEVNIKNKIDRVKNLEGVFDRNPFKQYKQYYYNDESSNSAENDYNRGNAWSSSYADDEKCNRSLSDKNNDNLYGRDIDINELSIRWLTQKGFDKSGNTYDPSRLITKYTNKVAEEGKPYKIIELLFKQCESAKQTLVNFMSNKNNLLYIGVIKESVRQIAHYISVLRNTEIAFNNDPESFELQFDSIQSMYQRLRQLIEDLNNFKPQNKNESLLLEGKNYEQTYQKFLQKLNQSDLKNTREANNAQFLFRRLIEADPTFNEAIPSSTGDYGEWIIRQYFNKNIHFNREDLNSWDAKLIYDKDSTITSDDTSALPFPISEEDDEELTVNSLLDEFNSNKKILPQKDIGAYKTPWQLKEAIEAAIEADANKPVIQNEKMQGKNIPEAKLVFKDDKYTVYIPLSYQGSLNLGRNTGWCITQIPENNGKQYYYDYLESGGYYYFIFDRRDKNRRFLFHFETRQFEAPHKKGQRVGVNPQEVIDDDEELKTFLGINRSIPHDEYIDFVLDETTKYARITGGHRNFNNLIIKTSEIPTKYFRNCHIHNITFEGSLQKIGVGAFYNSCIHCDVVLPNTLIEIGEDAFQECTFSDNYKLIIPNSVQILGEHCIGIDTEEEENSGLEIIGLDNLITLGAQYITSTSIAKQFLEAFKNSKVESFDSLAFRDMEESLNIVLPKTLQSIMSKNILVTFEKSNCNLNVVFPPSLNKIPTTNLPVTTNYYDGKDITYIVSSNKMFEVMRQIYHNYDQLRIKIKGKG